MKIVPISISLFLALILCIVINVAFVNSSVDYLSDTAEKLKSSDERDTLISELEDFWTRRRDLIGLSVSNATLEQANNVIICLKHAHISNDEAEFQKYCDLLSDVSKSIGRNERLSIGNIF